MKAADILMCRLRNQKLIGYKCRRPEDVVQHLVAMQAQEFAHAKWAIALRTANSTHTDIADAFNEGSILRTHVLRPTWHFVHPGDMRWLLSVSAPRVHAVNAYQYRNTGLDNTVFRKARKLLIKYLQGHQYKTRDEIGELFSRHGLEATGVRLAYIIMHEELDGIICSGPRRGNQFTYALLEEKAAPLKTPPRDWCLHELTRRYFSTRGPATIEDFVWWSGLTKTEARKGLDMTSEMWKVLDTEKGKYYMRHDDEADAKFKMPTFLMPDYDEYGISYKDRYLLTSKFATIQMPNRESAYNHWIIIDGFAAGAWRLWRKVNEVTVDVKPFSPLLQRQQRQVDNAVKEFLNFHNSKK